MAKTRLRTEEHTHVLVKTFGGNTILPRESWVWVRVGEKAVKKRVADVQPGDRVLERNTSVNVSLGEIKSALLKDDAEYRDAHAELFTDGKPRLQAFLHRVLQNNGINTAGLNDEKKMRQAIDFITNRLSRVDSRANKLYGEKKTVRLARSESSVRSWLTGETVLPSDPRALRVLRGLDPKGFDAAFGRPQQLKATGTPNAAENPLLWAHSFRSSAHSTLRNWVAGFSPRALGEDESGPSDSTRVEITHEKPKGTGRSFAVQRDLVYDRLVKPIRESIDKEHAFTRVKSVQPLSSSEAKKSEPRKGGSKMPRGVLPADRSRPKNMGVEESSVRELLRESGTIELLARNLCEHAVLPSKISGDNYAKGIIALSLLERPPALPESGKTIGLYTKDGDYSAQGVLNREELERLLASLRRQVNGGEIDQRAELPEGTTQKLIQHHLELHRNLPPSVIEARQGAQTAYNDFLRHAEALVHGEAASSADRRPASTAEDRIASDLRRLAAQASREISHHRTPLEIYDVPIMGVLFPTREDTSQLKYGQRLELETERFRQLFGGKPPYHLAPLSRQEIITSLSKAGVTEHAARHVISLTGLHAILE